MVSYREFDYLRNEDGGISMGADHYSLEHDAHGEVFTIEPFHADPAVAIPKGPQAVPLEPYGDCSFDLGPELIFHADPAVAIPIEVDSDPWFHDYEPCGDCGFDHAYEYADAIAWHKRDDAYWNDPKDGG